MEFVLNPPVPCPKCQRPIKTANIVAHPSRRDLAIHDFACEKCGPVGAKLVSLKPKPNPDKPP
jgi:hypothetical protein